MCFNKEVSLLVFLLGLATSIKLLNESNNKQNNLIKYKYYATSLLIFVISLMQLVEFFIWSYQNPKTNYHQIFSICIYITLFIQIVACYFSVVYFDLIKVNEIFQYLFLTLLFVTNIVAFLYGLYFVCYKRFGSFKTTKTSCSKRLRWSVLTNLKKHYSSVYYLLMFSYFAICLLSIYYILGLNGILLIAFSILLALIYSYKCLNIQFGSIWCIIVLFLTVPILLSNGLDLFIS